MKPNTLAGRFPRLRSKGLLAGALATALLVSACGSGGGDGAGAKADKVIIGTTVSLDAMNPLNDQYDTFQYNAFDSLVRFELGATEPEPRLATSWERIDSTTWRFTLRDATFHDGSPVTADDVKFSFDTAKAEGYSAATWIAGVKEVTVVDERTVEITTAEPMATLLNAVAQIFIVPKAVWEEVGPDAFSNNPIGSGPFKVTQFTPGSSATFTTYDGFWGAKPATETVELRVFRDAASLQSALESEEIDVAQELDISALRTLDGDDRFAVESAFSGNLNMFQLNTAKAPFSDLRVRQAAIKAIDADALITALTQGIGIKEDGQLAVPGVIGYSESIKRPGYDPEGAKSLLKEAGAEGAKVELLALAAQKPLLEAVAAQLREVGFDPEIKAVDVSVWVQAFRQGTDADIFYRGLAFSGFNDLDRPFSLISTGSRPFVTDAKWTQMLAASRVEFDPAKREEKLVEMSQYLLDQAYILYTYGRPTVGARLTSVSGIDFSTGLMLKLDEVKKG